MAKNIIHLQKRGDYGKDVPAATHMAPSRPTRPQGLSVAVGGEDWRRLQTLGIYFYLEGTARPWRKRYYRVVGHGRVFTTDAGEERQYIYFEEAHVWATEEEWGGEHPGPSFNETADAPAADVEADVEAQAAQVEAARVAKADEQAKAQAAAAAANHNLPALTGTPKQRAWAEDIRAEYFANTLPGEVLPQARRAKTAKWWIDHRAELKKAYAWRLA